MHAVSSSFGRGGGGAGWVLPRSWALGCCAASRSVEQPSQEVQEGRMHQYVGSWWPGVSNPLWFEQKRPAACKELYKHRAA